MKEEESATQLVWWSERQLTRLFSVGGKKQINIARQTLPKFQISSASVQYTPQLRNHPHHAVSYTDPDLRCHWLRNERGYRLDRIRPVFHCSLRGSPMPVDGNASGSPGELGSIS